MRGDAVVVGAGILGVASAWHLHRAGWRVTVLEKDAFAREASVRNFGMVWPIGQPLGERRALALRSRGFWLEALREADLWHDPCGSLHVFTDDLEAQVASEWLASAPAGLGEMVSPAQVAELSPLARAEESVAGMFSPDEVCVDPREATAGLTRYLESEGVRFVWDCMVGAVQGGRVDTSRGTFEGDLVVTCPGAWLASMRPGLYSQGSARLVRLHMLRATPLPGAPSAGTLLCSGLTLLHYPAFVEAPSLPKLKELMEARFPSQIAWGIHGLVSQHGDGTLTLGDSHEYGHRFPPYESAEVDGYMLDYLTTFIDQSAFEISQRWTGVYCQSTEAPFLIENSEPGLVVIAAAGGAGMTLSFGLTEHALGAHLAPKETLL